KDDTCLNQIKFHQNSLGATSDPFASWLTLRGVKTLGVRMKAHCENATRLAQYLESHEAVVDVIYPGLASHPQYAIAKGQMVGGFGGMIAVRVQGGEAEARQFMKSLKVFTLAESLGGIESLIEHPARMTHLSVDKSVRDALGITDNLVRLSVGIEDYADLEADVAQALAQIQAGSQKVKV
ncbi:MAG: PLP-dependent transferase, partial [Cyanobacteria bacterium]|nr:PLP-dependent transferase [Cyanobacteriota bacterium]